jgi:putative Ca2+/H+ antiporter (TMEM165/GDT1 family)
MRIFDGFSFLVSMLVGAFLDLRYFLAFFSIVIGTFALMLYVLLPAADARYASGVSYLIIALRTSLGDNEMEDYQTPEKG